MLFNGIFNKSFFFPFQYVSLYEHEIYRGPTSNMYVFKVFHAVIVVATRGRWRTCFLSVSATMVKKCMIKGISKFMQLQWLWVLTLMEV